ncbi:hypothetical protein V1477_021346 [Vespula maculifrons]|uniref:Uncharacterized protein n=1 Tax=Vespula maculifrons TaxID=7453 RepID=A0ABD2AGW6_VESMC
MKKKEISREYYLVMKELVVGGTVKTSRQHVLRVIIDGERKKPILYGAKGLHDFKERLQREGVLHSDSRLFCCYT